MVIKKIKTNGIDGLVIHEVGKLGVTEIRDNSTDSEHNFNLSYLVYVRGMLRFSYDNGKFEIEYME